MNKSLLEALNELKAELEGSNFSPLERKIPLMIKLEKIIQAVRDDSFTY